MITKQQRRAATESTDNLVTAVLKCLMIHELNRRIAYWRFKRIHSKKYGHVWRRYNDAIAACQVEIQDVLSPNWCKQK